MKTPRATLVPLLLVALCTVAQAQLTLVRDGKSEYQIIIASTAISSERYAADELQRYIAKMSGARLDIVSNASPEKPYAIILGDSAPAAGLGNDGFILKTEPNRLLIAGGKPRGTLNGVYALLEEHLGVRWFTPELETVPERKTVSLPRLDQSVVPPLEYREVYWTEMFRNADFAARHRLNGHIYSLSERHGGRAVVYYPFVHSFEALIPTNLFATHPEYFPYRKGKRIGGYVQRCLSNPDVVKLAKDTVRDWIRKHPQATIISVSQNDVGEWCQCDVCKQLDDAEGSPCASLLKFVNAIAEDIEKDYPRVRLDTLAYQYTRKPPKTIRPRPNVIIRLCSIECCFAHPLDTCPSEANRRFRDDIIAWQPIAPLLYIWDYTPNFAHYLQPFPNFDAIQPNVRFFVQHGVKGVFEQGNYSTGGNGEMGPLRAYLLAKLLWNPEADLKQHLQEFTDAYYGKAAPKVRAYIEVAHRPVRERSLHAHIFDAPKAAYLDQELITSGLRILDEAEQLAESDTIKARVQVTRLPVWYLQIANNLVTGDAKTQLVTRFVEVARKAGITHISEGRSLDNWGKSLLPAPAPANK